MKTGIDIIMLMLIGTLCWHGYQSRQTWLRMIPHLMWRICRNRGFLWQLLVFGSSMVGWLLLCHWINARGWYATAAGVMLLGMTLGLEAMRSAEERQKMEGKR
jgi:hypothetical protein